MNTLGDKLMELSAIYHRPESEYAYLYKDKKLHIRIRTKKGDIESINLHYGDPFIFMEEFYQDTKEMVKITSGTLFDHWQVEVSVDFARIQYLFELRDTEGQNILYGDKGCVENSLENLHAIGNGFKLPYLHEIDACKVPDWVSNTVWYQIFPERFANGNALLNPEGTLDWDSLSHLRAMISLVVIYRGLLIIWITCKTWVLLDYIFVPSLNLQAITSTIRQITLKLTVILETRRPFGNWWIKRIIVA